MKPSWLTKKALALHILINVSKSGLAVNSGTSGSKCMALEVLAVDRVSEPLSAVPSGGRVQSING
jgi:hypothetical protein